MQAQEAIVEELRRLAASALQLDLSVGELAGVTRLDDLAGFDSLGIIVFVASVEKAFGVTLRPDELKRETVADLPRLAGIVAARRMPPC